MKYDVITFGAASQDIFLQSEQFKKVSDPTQFTSGAGICFNLGSKINVRDVMFFSGGGGSNTAVSFANQGLKVAYCGSLNKDSTGKDILKELKKKGVKTNLVVFKTEHPTNTSVVLSIPGEDRTILVYRGASEVLENNDIPWRKLNTKWFYLAPLSGNLCNLFAELAFFAKKNGIKVAANPGQCQLTLPKEQLLPILKNIDILILNQEEASLLTGIPYSQEKEIFNKIDEWCNGIVIMTKGKEGSVVADGKYLYRAESLPVNIKDTTGAGDAFGSGFLSGFIKSKGDIEYALQLATANASGCIQAYGAKPGLLTKDSIIPKVKISKESCLDNNICVVK